MCPPNSSSQDLALRLQIHEKFSFSVKLQQELLLKKLVEDNKLSLYALEGSRSLGSVLRLQSCSEEAMELSKCSLQWYRLSSQCSRNKDERMMKMDH
ncbi:hypothetical protein SSX86_000930 [Deinandra increscens subsp. villosa]|uniref:Stomatal closure-related actin-binding protein Ig domain-containing protein n=1 Tax=Deinandra increscens subsp. villosa TaxID=3103831 RepID=A0AAP0HE15_9ASTR